MNYKFFDKKSGSGISVNEQPAKKLHKPVTEKFKRTKVYARFKDNIWAADLVEIDSFLLKTKMLNIHYVSQMFSLNMYGLSL